MTNPRQGEEVSIVTSEPESITPQGPPSEGMVPPPPADAAPVTLPGAALPPPHEAVEAAHELTEKTKTSAPPSATGDIAPAPAASETPEPIEDEAEEDAPFAP